MWTWLGAIALDALWVETPNRYHPVAWFGRAAQRMVDAAESRGQTSQHLRWMGIAIAVGLPLTVALGVMVIQNSLPRWPRWAFEVWLLSNCFTLSGLGRAALRMANALERGGALAGRDELKHLCSRSPEHLSQEELAAATVESVAENSSDSVIAPLFFYLWFGLPGAAFYRAVNTLDAMIGYFGRYSDLGWASARLDDLLNYIPARITSGLLLISGAMHGASLESGYYILKRDGHTTPSPNAGQPMAAMAGLLGVRLEKLGVYALGDPHNEVRASTIREAWLIVQTAGWLMFGFGILFLC